MRCRQAATKCPGLGRNRPRRNGHAQFAPDGPGASAQDRHRGGTSGNPGGSQSEHGRPAARIASLRDGRDGGSVQAKIDDAAVVRVAAYGSAGGSLFLLSRTVHADSPD